MASLSPAAQALLACLQQLQTDSRQLLILARAGDWPAFIEQEQHIARLRAQLPEQLPAALVAAGVEAGPETQRLAELLQTALDCHLQAEQLAQPQLLAWHDELQQASSQRRLNQAYGLGEN